MNNAFEGLFIPLDSISTELLKVICLTADGNYKTALQENNKIINKQDTEENKNIARMMSALITVLSGNEEAGLEMLKGLKKKFKSKKAKNICKKAIKIIK